MISHSNLARSQKSALAGRRRQRRASCKARLAYTYDAAHRLTGISDADGNRIVYTLDATGNRIKEDITDPSGQLSQTRQRAYDALNRLYQDIGAQNQTATYTYDANGNRTGVTDPLGRRTTQAYDALNRLIVLTDPANGQTRIGYDSQDRATQITDPRNLVTRYDIDGLGNLLQQTSPDTGSTQSRYDEAGNLVGRTDAKGQGIVLQYDVLNRPTQVGYPDGREERYTWDQGTNGIGRLTRIDERQDGQLTVSTAYAYDPHGRLTRETRTDGTLTLTTAYAYQNGVLTGITYPSGKQVSYARDAQGRISRIDLTDDGQTQTVVSQVAYHPFGGLKSYVDGAGHVIERQQDTDGRTSAYSLGSGLWQLGYDAAGRIVSQGDGTNAASYGYDSLDRLTSAVTPTATWGYVYDANGNRTSQTTGTTTSSYQIDPASNRLMGISGPSPRSYTYDANGSIIDDGQAQYRYDARGRMTQATTADGSTQYRIDAEGRRIAKANATGDTRYVYDRAGHLLAEMDANGKATREYLWLGDLPVGVVQSPTGTGFELPLGFAGQVRDRETGLSQNGFRDYDPATGRYRQFDLIGLRGGINGYTYAGGNPMLRIDPLGLDWLDDAANFSAGFGDSLSFGLTSYAREGLGIGGVNKCSGSYRAGEMADLAFEVGTMGLSAGLKALAASTSRTAARNGARPFVEAFRETNSLEGGFIHHSNPLFGHPGGFSTMFPTGGLPSALNSGAWNLRWFADSASHSAAHQAMRGLENGWSALVNPGTTGIRAARDVADACSCQQ